MHHRQGARGRGRKRQRQRHRRRQLRQRFRAAAGGAEAGDDDGNLRCVGSCAHRLCERLCGTRPVGCDAWDRSIARHLHQPGIHRQSVRSGYDRRRRGGNSDLPPCAAAAVDDGDDALVLRGGSRLRRRLRGLHRHLRGVVLGSEASGDMGRGEVRLRRAELAVRPTSVAASSALAAAVGRLPSGSYHASAQITPTASATPSSPAATE